ncbi:hypothetical protein [Pyxidicoccus xibeiensis]|uniref:hypothetical protein n=1 Tax=Pyxidicoccus xibeiensis TaxID=2906759 RepID=UPI0020A7D2F4|nr:hypothetical protein [Pyxidicoccus xibeiensis]MCP3138484.1 hypothetical protein [Pyxidicoccus xibeiensis]
MPDIRVVLLMLVLSPGLVRAQALEPVSVPPPLVAVEDAPELEVAPVAPEAMSSMEVAQVQWQPDPPGRIVGRVLFESMGGTLAGVGGAFVGLLGSLMMGGLSWDCTGDSCDGRGLVGGALVGWSLGAATGVYGGGALLDGRGRFLPTVGMGLLSGGVAAGLYVSRTADDELVPLLIALPLVTSIVTYEITSARTAPAPRPLADSRGTGAWWTPTVGVSERGGSLGLIGRF